MTAPIWTTVRVPEISPRVSVMLHLRSNVSAFSCTLTLSSFSPSEFLAVLMLHHPCSSVSAIHELSEADTATIRSVAAVLMKYTVSCSNVRYSFTGGSGSESVLSFLQEHSMPAARARHNNALR
ncbi:MAG: hypothetical protein L6V35_07370 [Alistipes putredinis]|nr:MAG: hypothetical protein L6V35_07370 [Alistipes putredinis]